MQGLGVAARLSRAGVATRLPRLTTSGALGLAFDHAHQQLTLALLAYEPGDPIDVAASVAPRRLGDLLGRVHVASLRRTSRADAPARLVEWRRDRHEVRGDAA